MAASLKQRYTHTSPAFKVVLAFIVIGVLAFFVPFRKFNLDVGSVLSATAIFYSILLGFFIAAAMANLSRLKTLVATETGALIAIERIVRLSLPSRSKEMKELVDDYIIKRFDYEIHEYTEPTTEEYFAIFNILKGAKTDSEGEAAALEYVGECMYYVAQARREITIAGARVVTPSSWLILIILSLIIIFCLFLGRDGTWESALVTTFLSTSAILALFILDEVDGNRLGEEQFAIDTYNDVLAAIGKEPYYPTLYLQGGRYKPPAKHYRTGSHGHVREVNR